MYCTLECIYRKAGQKCSNHSSPQSLLRKTACSEWNGHHSLQQHRVLCFQTDLLNASKIWLNMMQQST